MGLGGMHPYSHHAPPPISPPNWCIINVMGKKIIAMPSSSPPPRRRYAPPLSPPPPPPPNDSVLKKNICTKITSNKEDITLLLCLFGVFCCCLGDFVGGEGGLCFFSPGYDVKRQAGSKSKVVRPNNHSNTANRIVT